MLLREIQERGDELNDRLVDKCFVNFSVFESIPDVWAIDQVFAIVPIERLDERLQRRGIVRDMTWHSDGMVKTYVENESQDSSLPLNATRPGESCRIGFFWSAPIRSSWATSATCSETPTRWRSPARTAPSRITQQRRGIPPT